MVAALETQLGARLLQRTTRKLALTDEFGTPDRLPPKPYIREGLRLEALTMLREQDLRTPHPEPKWAKLMPADGVFGFFLCGGHYLSPLAVRGFASCGFCALCGCSAPL